MCTNVLTAKLACVSMLFHLMVKPCTAWSVGLTALHVVFVKSPHAAKHHTNTQKQETIVSYARGENALAAQETKRANQYEEEFWPGASCCYDAASQPCEIHSARSEAVTLEKFGRLMVR
jgi:hypothetical protein